MQPVNKALRSGSEQKESRIYGFRITLNHRESSMQRIRKLTEKGSRIIKIIRIMIRIIKTPRKETENKPTLST